jgi:hypothetical protein
MKLRNALIAAIFFVGGPAMAQTQPSTAATPAPQHIPGQPGAKPATPAPADKPVEKLDPAKEAAIRHLMDITETSKMGDNLNIALIRQVREFMTRALPPDQLSKFMDTFSQKYTPKASPAAVTDAMVPIYARNFSMEEIQSLTKFYESPLGQHVVKVMPQVVGESQAAGAQIDQPIAMTILRSMEPDYPQLKQMLPPDPAAAPASDAPASSGTPATTPQAPPKLAPSTPAPSTTPPATTPPQR